MRLGFPDAPLKPYVRFGQRRSPAFGCRDRATIMRDANWTFYGNEVWRAGWRE